MRIKTSSHYQLRPFRIRNISNFYRPEPVPRFEQWITRISAALRARIGRRHPLACIFWSGFYPDVGGFRDSCPCETITECEADWLSWSERLSTYQLRVSRWSVRDWCYAHDREEYSAICVASTGVFFASCSQAYYAAGGPLHSAYELWLEIDSQVASRVSRVLKRDG